jgi:hypothetical protein
MRSSRGDWIVPIKAGEVLGVTFSVEGVEADGFEG